MCRLHIVKPCAFSLADRNLRRPGLDYWPYLDLEIHDQLEDLLAEFPITQVAFFSKSAEKTYRELPVDTKLIVFGRETSGLPLWLWEKYPQAFYNIPLYHKNVRSLNVANAVSIITYHLLAIRERVY